jgi:hypothetical protein
VVVVWWAATCLIEMKVLRVVDRVIEGVVRDDKSGCFHPQRVGEFRHEQVQRRTSALCMAVWTNEGSDMEWAEDGITAVIGVLAARDSAGCHQPAYIAS